MAINKLANDYAEMISYRTYQQIPKAVLAAIVVSRLVNLEGLGTTEAIEKAIVDEWSILHQNGIVPQKPPRMAMPA